MAAHVSSIRSSGVEQVSIGQFYALMQWGDFLFCSGSAAISKVIEKETGSPYSHVLTIWVPNPSAPWLTREAVIDKGIRVGPLSEYVNDYPGDLMLARRPGLSDLQKTAMLNTGLSLLDDHYDWQGEVSIAARKLLKCFPVVEPKNELFCSGLVYAESLTPAPANLPAGVTWLPPLQRPGPNYPTPEDIWTDPTVVPVCALIRA